MCSISKPPVVDNLAYLKHYAKALFTNLTASLSTKKRSAALALSFLFVFSY